MIVQARAFGFAIREVPVTTKYFKDASSVNFRVSTIYGFKTLGVITLYLLWRLDLSRRLLALPSQGERSDVYRNLILQRLLGDGACMKELECMGRGWSRKFRYFQTVVVVYRREGAPNWTHVEVKQASFFHAVLRARIYLKTQWTSTIRNCSLRR